ncbi:putative oxidoreductase, aryl-alcohol dehydrogenase like protein [gamma proteobacterium HIMB55]|nr:putative oxidoreductase, aryl-alcohol dehydrogenase like protein [gamma proteobacterium HIMB55]
MTLRTIDGKEVSKICLGTMTWGQQNTEAEAHEQISYALDRGINMLDAAEMYPVPPRAETQGRTEEYIGTWFKKTGLRDKYILATKAAGPNPEFHYLRGGPRFTREQLMEAVDGSLRRLQTDCIDLYQLHWPDRYTNFFGQRGYFHREQPETPIDETLRALQELVAAGKIKTIGLSNETPWGTMKFLELADREGLPRVESIQNPYGLLNRTYEIAMAEVSHREDVGLLAYSPLGMGLLTGKYRHGAKPEGSRMAVFERFTRYDGAETLEATEQYLQLADEHGLNPTHMALAFVNTRPFVLSNIIGATTMEQLKMNIDSLDVNLSKDVLKGIEAIQQRLPNPAP